MGYDNTTTIATDEERVFRWLNYGSCMMRIAFDTPKFTQLPYQGLPVKVSKIWRREISSVMLDWSTVRSFSATLKPSLFSDAWVSDVEVFRSADVILADLVLDIFQDQHLRFRCPGETGGVSYKGVVSNFPEEPPEELEAELCIFDCNSEQSLRAWEQFGQEIDTPTVFITYEHRDEIPVGYSEAFRNKLLDYQDRVVRLAAKFPHWLVISLDDVFKEVGLSCYVDRHHPTPLGWDILREAVPKLISASGILRQNPGGAPLSASTKYIPERADFATIDPGYLRRLTALDGGASVVGPKRLTDFALNAFGDAPLAVFASFSQLQRASSPGLIIVMKWDQPITVPNWLFGLMKQHPESIIEIPCLWRGRALEKAEMNLRQDIKRFAKAKKTSVIDLPDLSVLQKRYVARLLLSTHLRDAECDRRLLPITAGAETGASVTLPQNLLDAILEATLIPVFSAHS